MASVPQLWGRALDCVNTPLRKRLESALSLLEAPDPWTFLSSSPPIHGRSILSTASEVLQADNVDDIGVWCSLVAGAFVHLPPPHAEEGAVVRLLRKVGPYMTLLPVAIASASLFPPNDESIQTLLCETWETTTPGREFIWEGLVRAFNQVSRIPPSQARALSRCISILLRRDSLLIYQTDFQVLVDILVRESTDLEIQDPRRQSIAVVLQTCLESPVFIRSDLYRQHDLRIVVKQWREALTRDNPRNSTFRELAEVERALEQIQ
ncbi:hypothetical protein LEN26_014587 [Aphanomyces euteiches]|nr:hypothetical protein LEN26_014587 [Aphanomyces euteiches]KAH9124473.1 hypothetical protein AeMF1_004767 [Aphanomyces euteiches]KAH9186686.1 hypothetical protein AeNC1_011336 [Aphanomyces euteiches]